MRPIVLNGTHPGWAPATVDNTCHVCSKVFRINGLWSMPELVRAILKKCNCRDCPARTKKEELDKLLTEHKT